MMQGQCAPMSTITRSITNAFDPSSVLEVEKQALPL